MEDRVSKGCIAATLKLSNSVMSMTGIAILMYSVWIIAVCLRDYQNYPFPWFLWVCLGTGMIFNFVAFIGHAAAATRFSCFLSTYILFLFLLMLVESLITADIYLNKDWYKDFPADPTGRFDAFVRYVDSHKENFRRLGLFIACSQVISFLLAMVLRSKPPPKSYLEDEEEEVISAIIPFLNPQIRYPGTPPYALGHPADPHYYYEAAPPYTPTPTPTHTHTHTHGYPDIEGNEKGEAIAAAVQAIPKGC